MFCLLFWFPAFLFFLFIWNDSWMIVISDHRYISMLSHRNTIRSNGSGRRVQPLQKAPQSDAPCKMYVARTQKMILILTEVNRQRNVERFFVCWCVDVLMCVSLFHTHTLCTDNPSAAQQMAKEKAGGWTEAQIQLVAPLGLSSSRCFFLMFLSGRWRATQTICPPGNIRKTHSVSINSSVCNKSSVSQTLEVYWSGGAHARRGSRSNAVQPFVPHTHVSFSIFTVFFTVKLFIFNLII